VIALNILNSIIGSTCEQAEVSGNRALLKRASKNIIHNSKYSSFIDGAHALNFNFSDTGLFGLCLKGDAHHGAEVLQALIEQLKALKDISKDELLRGQAALKNHIFHALERQSDRLEETVKNIKTFGSVRHQEYAREIDSVSVDQINKVVNKILNTQPTFVAHGPEVSKLLSTDKIANALRG